MKIDLHTHSRASDGSLTPAELVRLAKSLNISTLSLTDHDTIDGVAEAVTAGEREGLDVIPGIELSVNHEIGSLHLLGYGIDINCLPFLQTVNHLKNSRTTRNVRILARLEELGYPVSAEAVTGLAGPGTVGRGHIAMAMVEAGYFSSAENAFKALLNRGAPAYIDRYRLSLGEAVDLIHRAGGAAVWAHPGLHGADLPVMLRLLPGWVERGLDGLESDYSQHPTAFRDEMRRVAAENGLIFTGGSDFHGALKPNIRLGQGPEGRDIALECLEGLKKRLQTLENNRFSHIVI